MTAKLMSLSVLNISACPKLEMIGKETRGGEATVLPGPDLTQLDINYCENLKPMPIQMEGNVLLPKLRLLMTGK